MIPASADSTRMSSDERKRPEEALSYVATFSLSVTFIVLIYGRPDFLMKLNYYYKYRLENMTRSS